MDLEYFQKVSAVIMEKMQQCSVGLERDDECHKKSFTSRVGLMNAAELDDEEKELIALRAEMKNSIDTACFHHKQFYLVKFMTYQDRCCDPFHSHKKPVHGSLRLIKMELVKSAQRLQLHLIPGKKLCPTCRKTLSAIEASRNDSTEEDSSDEMLFVEESVSRDEDRDQL
ncbi:ARL14 effector protein-like [Penaeus indicus]|uniref:ARL14 effector protein-like n=1 Tax=Penaeus indicus TaxID=29960 RepID=UPI00300C263F